MGVDIMRNTKTFNRRSFLKTSGCSTGFFLFGGLCGHSSNTATVEKPNILFIVSDDLGIELGCYGHGTVRSPHIDSLAADGVRFETAWVTQASCSPSRSSMHTGLYPHQNGQIGLTHRGYSMHRELPTITSILKENGYTTGVIGKFHIEPESACPWDYEYRNRQIHHRSRDVARAAEKAGEFIEKCGDKPFYLMASYPDPHVPHYDQRRGLPENPLKPEDVEPLPFFGMDTPRLREQTAGYYNCISRLDSGIGMLLDEVKRAGKYENTLIIFIGDHGAPFDRAKTTNYDIGLRIPFIVKWHGRTKAGLVREELVSTIDILPTVLDAVGIEPPAGLPGRSVLPLAEGRDVDWREYMLGVHHAHTHFQWFPRRTVREQRYQLIENLMPGRTNPPLNDNHYVDHCRAWHESRCESLEGTQVREAYDTYAKPPRFELYDLQEDPYSMVNLADSQEHAPVLENLRIQMQRLREETQDPYLDEEYLEEMTEIHDRKRAEHLPN